MDGNDAKAGVQDKNYPATGVYYNYTSTANSYYQIVSITEYDLVASQFHAYNVVPTGNHIVPRAYGVLACIYLGA